MTYKCFKSIIYNTYFQFTDSLKNSGDTRFLLLWFIDQSECSITNFVNNNIRGENCLFKQITQTTQILWSWAIVKKVAKHKSTHLLNIAHKHLHFHRNYACRFHCARTAIKTSHFQYKQDCPRWSPCGQVFENLNTKSSE